LVVVLFYFLTHQKTVSYPMHLISFNQWSPLGSNPTQFLLRMVKAAMAGNYRINS
jgi:hypothetical protein